MNLNPENLKVGTFHQHLLNRKQKKKARKRNVIATLTLTSMVDMFSLLVIFLLQSFSASPELITITKGLSLPAAVSGREMKDAPILSLSKEHVYLDQKLVGKTDQLLEDPSSLTKKLGELRTLWQKNHPNEAFNGEINLQADRGLPSTIVSQYMAILPTQFYSTVQLAVVSQGK